MSAELKPASNQEAMTVEHAFKLLRSSFNNGVTRLNGYETYDGRHLRAVETVAADRAALVAERDEALIQEQAAQREEYKANDRAEQAVAERDRYRDALRSEIEKRHYRGDGKRLTDAEIDALVVAARAVSTP
jgi:hypothetical protein